MKRPKPWSEWTTVERVEVYSRGALIGLMWVAPIAVIAQRGFWRGPYSASTWVSAGFLVFFLVVGSWALAKPKSMSYEPRFGRRWQGLFYAYMPITIVLSSLGEHDPLQLTVSASFLFIWCWMLGTVPGRAPAIIVLAIGLVAPAALTGRLAPGLLGVVGAAFCLFATRSSMWLQRSVRDLDEARTAQADLAVAEERLRFSRDVHDVLGRRLSAIALQAELAARLSERGDPGAPGRMLEVRATAHEALREARELARGYRPVDLEQEVNGARSLLAAAGIELDARLDDLPEPAHEAAAWVVRETLTNVLRHSDATLVVLTWRSPWLVVVNDRPNRASDGGDGAGLTGLEERLATRGGALETLRDHDYFTVRARLPLDEPAMAGAGAP